ncbi:MAG TPA: hypothetical protein P5277_02785 [Candidatus Paceibacterota bacterium]|nr:hypothetical protein [Candidatus Paceibacterota bacterium]
MIGKIRTGIGLVPLLLGSVFSTGEVQAQNSPAENYFIGQTIRNLGSIGPGSREQQLNNFGRRSLQAMGDSILYETEIEAQKDIARAGRPQQNINVTVNNIPNNTSNIPQNSNQPAFVQQYPNLQYSGDITNVEVIHNKFFDDGSKGMEIKIVGELNNLKNVPIEAIVFFKYQNGEYLKDFDERYYNEKGKICTYETILPRYENTNINQSITIPYSQLHLSAEQKLHSLTAEIGLVLKDESVWLDSEEFNFEIRY